ncbi:hypothetical protein ACFZBU_17785 [Embleya sp. NPDC008237]|uniref:hypothetical protein n=1 Tax=Embleya sp. NPDC008237 TaxID=3363978 RepID=UPI0036EFCE06
MSDARHDVPDPPRPAHAPPPPAAPPAPAFPPYSAPVGPGDAGAPERSDTFAGGPGKWIALVAAGIVSTVVAALSINGTDGGGHDRKGFEDPAGAGPPAAAAQPLPAFPSIDTTARMPAESAKPARTADVRPSAPPAPRRDGRFTARPEDPNTWPDACDIVTADDVRGVFPDVRGVEVIGTADARGFLKSKGPALRSTTCKLTLDTPRVIDAYSTISLTVDIMSIATGAEMTHDWDFSTSGPRRLADYRELPPSAGADAGYSAQGGVQFRKDEFIVRITALGHLSTPDGYPQRGWEVDLLPRLVGKATARL